MHKQYQNAAVQTKSILVAGFLLFALTGLTTAMAQEGVLRVTYEKSLLDSPAGVEKLFKKLKTRTRRFCWHSVINSVSERETCNRELFARFVDQIDNRHLTHYADTGRHLEYQVFTAH